MSVITFRFFDSSAAYAGFYFHAGTMTNKLLNLTFTANVVKTGLFASLFPKHSSGVRPPLSVILCH